MMTNKTTTAARAAIGSTAGPPPTPATELDEETLPALQQLLWRSNHSWTLMRRVLWTFTCPSAFNSLPLRAGPQNLP
eukprot:4420451-Amphidinium_carterae.1